MILFYFVFNLVLLTSKDHQTQRQSQLSGFITLVRMENTLHQHFYSNFGLEALQKLEKKAKIRHYLPEIMQVKNDFFSYCYKGKAQSLMPVVF